MPLQLDPWQEAAATTGAQHALVVAGAGSGKTRCLTARASYLLGHGHHPVTLFIATFTRKAAGELADRLDDRALRNIGTLHSLTWRLVVKPYARLVGLTRPSIVDKQGTLSVLRRVAQGLVEEAGEDRYQFPLAEKADLRRYAEDISRHKAGMPVMGGPSFERLLHTYNTYLAERDLLDFDDILNHGVTILGHDGPRQAVAGGLSAVLIDEYQDTNRPQVELVRLLASEGACVFAVGDSDQSIYRWRGADPGNIPRLRQVFPDLEVFHLPITYRCPVRVVSMATRVISRNAEAFPGARVPLRPHDPGRAGTVARLECQDLIDQGERFAQGIARLLHIGVPPGDVAVLYRSRRALQPSRLPVLLRRERVPFKVVGLRALAEHAEVADLLGFAQLCLDPWRHEHHLARVCQRFSGILGLGLGDKALERMDEERRAEGLPLVELLPRHGTKDGGRRLANIIAEGRERSALGPATFLAWAREALHHEERCARDDTGEATEELLAAAAAAEAAGANLAEFIEEMALDADEGQGGGDRVALSTVHAAKGLEWPFVFVLGIDRGIWPDVRNAHGEAEAEERRALYVALTRAKEQLVWAYSAGNPSPFIDELKRGAA